ncbi:hypothetical protein OPV22_031750 [Ensete ventricosum]|uniref:Uncharacterized protein n=1 Tax=Ensete ventricosum TaxID=4639 RepID=A0AAV8PPR1_ENSVE|nr:hypothetical protein OPV22_031750 [Ensete ventricosum]
MVRNLRIHFAHELGATEGYEITSAIFSVGSIHLSSTLAYYLTQQGYLVGIAICHHENSYAFLGCSGRPVTERNLEGTLDRADCGRLRSERSGQAESHL